MLLWQTCSGSFEWVIHVYPFFWEDHPIPLLFDSCFRPGGFNHFQFSSLLGVQFHLCPWILIFRCVFIKGTKIAFSSYLFQQDVGNLKWFFSTSGLEVGPFRSWPSSWRSVATWRRVAIVRGLPMFDQWDNRRAEMPKGSKWWGFNLSPLLFQFMLCKMALLNTCNYFFLSPT